MIKDRVKNFLKVTGMSKAFFCKSVGIVPLTLRNYFNDKVQIRPENEQRMNEFIDEYRVRVQSV